MELVKQASFISEISLTDETFLSLLVFNYSVSKLQLQTEHAFLFVLCALCITLLQQRILNLYGSLQALFQNTVSSPSYLNLHVFASLYFNPLYTSRFLGRFALCNQFIWHYAETNSFLFINVPKNLISVDIHKTNWYNKAS